MKGVENRTWKQCLYGMKPATPFGSRELLKEMNPKEDRVVLECLDNSEIETLYIASVEFNPECSHMEIHPSAMFGVMGTQVLFPENSALARNDYSCIQGRQSVSIYHTNFFNRIDTTGVILNHGQKPIVKSRYTKMINDEEHPYGENAIVAIMCHTGFNVEDSILVNESSAKRGLFNMSYYSMYETYEETGDSEKRIGNPVRMGASHLKPGYSYNELDENGIIKENTLLDDKTVIIGRVGYSKEDPDNLTDASIFSAKGQSGIVDKVYISQNEEGRRIVKVRVREERMPNIGDKFASRCGQKGTVGMLIPEENMPFTKDGVKPDLIINPHCMPSRMTINQLIECLFCKFAVQKGCSIDSTPFVNKGPKHVLLAGLLNEYNLHSSGNEILYNGMTGEQIESEIYMGPTYYTRLKHMTQDKINYRARGPRAALTRQTNHGRSKDGGLRIGDMERDSILSHGMSSFMYDSMMVRGDYYKMAICNHSGTIAIYNRATQNFYSPMVDGPLQFEAVDSETMVPSTVTKYGKEFSIVEVPYCLKLLIHELTTMNVQMRLITADTVESLTTAGKRSLGSFQEWIQKEVPNTVLEKEKIEKLLNQTLSEEEFKAITEPTPLLPNLNVQEREPNQGEVNEQANKQLNVPVNKPVNVPTNVPILKNGNSLNESKPLIEPKGLSLNDSKVNQPNQVNQSNEAPAAQPNLSLNNTPSSTPVTTQPNLSLNNVPNPGTPDGTPLGNQADSNGSNESNESNKSNESNESNESNNESKEETTKVVKFA